jgi:hypothetical protein
VHDVKALDLVLREDEYATPRFNLTLLSLFAGVGLVLALVGVFGVMSTAVAQQRHEIGVRMALGADGGSIARMVVTRGVRLLLIGMALGLAGSLGAAQFFHARRVWERLALRSPRVRRRHRYDPARGGLRPALLPAIRASRIDPIIALRQERGELTDQRRREMRADQRSNGGWEEGGHRQDTGAIKVQSAKSALASPARRGSDWTADDAFVAGGGITRPRLPAVPRRQTSLRRVNRRGATSRGFDDRQPPAVSILSSSRRFVRECRLRRRAF